MKNGALSGKFERGLAVLEYFAIAREASPIVVAEVLGISRSATYRILDDLRERGYLEINPASEKLRLGIKAVELGMAALSGIDVVRLAPAYLRDLAQAASETAFLAAVNDGAVVYLYKEEGPQAITTSSQIGDRRPVHCTALGKAFMSALPVEDSRALIGTLDLAPRTANTITDRRALEDEILLTRDRGYAIDNVEVEEGVGCFAAPVFDYRGLPVAGISVAGPADRVLPKEERLGPLVAKTASVLSRRLGHVEPLRAAL